MSGRPTSTLVLPSACDVVPEKDSVPSVVAAGEGEVGAVAGIGAVGAGLVLVVDLVVPGPVVEVLVVVDDLVAVEPVDRDALFGGGVGGGGVVDGVVGGGAADHPKWEA